jgi:BMFP domain-containing protein YqiC
MQTDNRFLDDLARIASGAVGTLQGVKAEIDGLVRREMERLLSGMELVRRDEFDAVKAMAAAARQENERLAARIAELEGRLAGESNPEGSASRD